MYDGLKNLEVPTKRKHPGARRAFKYTGILLLCGVVLAGATGYGLYRKIEDKLSKTHDAGINVKAAPLDGPVNILVLGSDDRTGLTKQELRDLHISRAGGRRSDTIILLRISPGKQAVMVHFPRDLWVDVSGRGEGRINTAYSVGGPNGVIKTVQSLTGMPINHYVEVSFAAFKGLVDAVGGVDLHVPKPLYDRRSGLNVQRTGCVRFDGKQALAFVRARYIYPNADLGRIQAQQRFMRALLGKVKSAGTILNPFKVSSIADAIGDGLKTDKGVNVELARSIAGALSDFGTDGVDFRVFPSSTRAGSALVYPNEAQAAEFFAALKADRPLPPYGKTKQSRVTPEDVSVAVYNGTATVGLAGREVDRLNKLSFEARVGGNAKRTSVTLVRYQADAAQKGALVAKQFPGAQLAVAANISSDVVVILGADQVSPSAAASAKPPGKAKPQIGQACG